MVDIVYIATLRNPKNNRPYMVLWDRQAIRTHTPGLPEYEASIMLSASEPPGWERELYEAHRDDPTALFAASGLDRIDIWAEGHLDDSDFPSLETGCPRSHAGVTEKGRGHGFVLYCGLALTAAYSSLERGLKTGHCVSSVGPAPQARSADAERFWTNQVKRKFAREQLVEGQREVYTLAIEIEMADILKHARLESMIQETLDAARKGVKVLSVKVDEPFTGEISYRTKGGKRKSRRESITGSGYARARARIKRYQKPRGDLDGRLIVEVARLETAQVIDVASVMKSDLNLVLHMNESLAKHFRFNPARDVPVKVWERLDVSEIVDPHFLAFVSETIAKHADLKPGEGDQRALQWDMANLEPDYPFQLELIESPPLKDAWASTYKMNPRRKQGMAGRRKNPAVSKADRAAEQRAAKHMREGKFLGQSEIWALRRIVKRHKRNKKPIPKYVRAFLSNMGQTDILKGVRSKKGARLLVTATPKKGGKKKAGKKRSTSKGRKGARRTTGRKPARKGKKSRAGAGKYKISSAGRARLAKHMRSYGLTKGEARHLLRRLKPSMTYKEAVAKFNAWAKKSVAKFKKGARPGKTGGLKGVRGKALRKKGRKRKAGRRGRKTATGRKRGVKRSKRRGGRKKGRKAKRKR